MSHEETSPLISMRPTLPSTLIVAVDMEDIYTALTRWDLDNFEAAWRTIPAEFKSNITGRAYARHLSPISPPLSTV
jgi:hypothetical protein